ncbi:MAG: hypothetical protein KC486_12690 [Myxococcales bacterium]|nr:hypothetical protein [Myxococcales bacterium]
MRSSATHHRRCAPHSLASLLLTLAIGCAGGGDDGGATESTSSTGSTGATDATTTGSSSSAATDATTDTTTGSTGETTGSGGAADGEPCSADLDCASKLCVEFRDHDPTATCAAAPADGNTRFTGTILDITAESEIAGAELRVLDALTALQNPAGAPVLIDATGDASGRVDVTTEERLPAGVGLVGLVVGEDLTPTTGMIAEPQANGAFGPGNTYHDLWVAPTETLTTWEALLAGDAEVAPHLPLAAGGAVIGLVRDGGSGTPLAGATLVSEEPESAALVRYLSEGRDAFDGEATASHGLVLVVNPGLAEGFQLKLAGELVDDARAEARGAAGSIGAMILEVGS